MFCKRKVATFSDEEICIETECQIRNYPHREPMKYANRPIVIGDLHSNALKLIHLLIKHNRLELSESAYQELVSLYFIIHYFITRHEYTHFAAKLAKREAALAKNELSVAKTTSLLSLRNYVAKKAAEFEQHNTDYLTMTGRPLRELHQKSVQDHLHRFNDILKNANVLSTSPVFLMGDDMRDRNLDNLVLDCYQLMDQKNIFYRTLFSNHGLRCIKDLEQPITLRRLAYPDRPHRKPWATQYHSFNRMALLVKLGILSEEKVQEQCHLYWLNKMNLLHYTIKDKEITIYSHAPIGLKTIQSLCNDFGVSYNFQSLEAFRDTLDKLNHEFELLKSAKKVYERAGVDKIKVDHGVFIPYEYPLARLAWTRREYESEGDEMPQRLANFFVRFVHGHHQFKPVQKSIPNGISLDDSFGKDIDDPAPKRSITLRPKKPRWF